MKNSNFNKQTSEKKYYKMRISKNDYLHIYKSELKEANDIHNLDSCFSVSNLIYTQPLSIEYKNIHPFKKTVFNNNHSYYSSSNTYNTNMNTEYSFLRPENNIHFNSNLLSRNEKNHQVINENNENGQESKGTKGTKYTKDTKEEILLQTEGDIFNNNPIRLKLKEIPDFLRIDLKYKNNPTFKYSKNLKSIIKFKQESISSSLKIKEKSNNQSVKVSPFQLSNKNEKSISLLKAKYKDNKINKTHSKTKKNTINKEENSDFPVNNLNNLDLNVSQLNFISIFRNKKEILLSKEKNIQFQNKKEEGYRVITFKYPFAKSKYTTLDKEDRNYLYGISNKFYTYYRKKEVLNKEEMKLYPKI